MNNRKVSVGLQDIEDDMHLLDNCSSRLQRMLDVLRELEQSDDLSDADLEVLNSRFSRVYENRIEEMRDVLDSLESTFELVDSEIREMRSE